MKLQLETWYQSGLRQTLRILRGTVKELPNREAIDVPVDEMLIVELYSK